MENFATLEDLFYYQLKELYSAETQLIKALLKMRLNASDQKLQEVLYDHLEETKKHRFQLDEISRLLKTELEGETCKAMKLLIEKTNALLLEEKAAPQVKDAGIIAFAQRMAEYKRARYASAHQFATDLRYTDTADILRKALQEGKESEKKLNARAQKTIHPKAKTA